MPRRSVGPWFLSTKPTLVQAKPRGREKNETAMAVLHLLARPSTAALDRLTHPKSAAEWSVCGWGEHPPRPLVEALARAGSDMPGLAWPLPAGLAAELTSRPTRRVETWLAWPAGEPPTGEPAGLATLVTASGGQRLRVSIGWLLVHPAARGRGLGRRLVATLLMVAQQRTIDRMWVETRSDWPAATAFWRACGFCKPD